jgi:ribosomal protein S27AE
MSREEGKRLEKDINAEIDPDKIYVVKRTNNKVCPNCRHAVDAGSRYCPNCGTSLL